MKNEGRRGPEKDRKDIYDNFVINHTKNVNSFFCPLAILKELSQYSHTNIDIYKFESALNSPKIDWLNDGTYGIINTILEFLGVPIESQPTTFSDEIIRFIIDVQSSVKDNKITQIKLAATLDIPFKQFEFQLGDKSESATITNSDGKKPNGSIIIKTGDDTQNPKYVKITNFQGSFSGIKIVNNEEYICFTLNNANYELSWLDTADFFCKQLSIQPKYTNVFKILLQAFIAFCHENPEYIIKSTEPYITLEEDHVIAKNVPQIDFKNTWNSLMNFINYGATSHNGAMATFVYALQSPLFYYLHQKTPDVKTYFLLLYGSSRAGKTPLANLFLQKGYLQKPEEYMFNRNGLNSATRWGMAFSAKYTLPFLADDVDNDLLIQHASDLKGYTETNNSVVRYDQTIHRRAITGTRYPIITMNSDFVNDNDTGITNRFFKILYGQKEKNKVDSQAFNSLKDNLAGGFMFSIFNEMYGHISIDDLIKITRNLNTPQKWVDWGINTINNYASKNNLEELLPLDDMDADHDTDRIYDLLNVLDAEYYKQQNDQNYRFHSEYDSMFDIEINDAKITYYITSTAYKLINRKLAIPSSTLSEFLRNVDAPDIHVESTRSTHRFKQVDNTTNLKHCYVVVKKIKDNIPENSYKIKVLKTFKFGDTTYFAHYQYSLPESTELPLKYLAQHFFEIIKEPRTNASDNINNNSKLESSTSANPDTYNKTIEAKDAGNSSSKEFTEQETKPKPIPEKSINSSFNPKFFQYRVIKGFKLDGYVFNPGYAFQQDMYLKELIENGSVECLNCEQTVDSKDAADSNNTKPAKDMNPAKSVKYRMHFYQVIRNFDKYSTMNFVKDSDILFESSRPVFKHGTSEIAYGLLELRIPEPLIKTPAQWTKFLRDSTELPSETAYNILARGDNV